MEFTSNLIFFHKYNNVHVFTLQVLENVWLVLKGNMSLMLSIATAALSIILGGGTAILNSFISAVSKPPRIKSHVLTVL